MTPTVTLLLAECIIFPELEQECVLPPTDQTIHLWQGTVGWYLSMFTSPPLTEHGSEHRWIVRPERPFLRVLPSSFIAHFSRQVQDSPSPCATLGAWLLPPGRACSAHTC